MIKQLIDSFLITFGFKKHPEDVDPAIRACKNCEHYDGHGGCEAPEVYSRATFEDIDFVNGTRKLGRRRLGFYSAACNRACESHRGHTLCGESARWYKRKGT